MLHSSGPKAGWATAAQGQAHPEGGFAGPVGGSKFPATLPNLADISSQPKDQTKSGMLWDSKVSHTTTLSGPV